MLGKVFFTTKTHTCLIFASLCSAPTLAFANDLEIEPAISTTGYVYETQIDDEEAQSNQAFVITPSVLASYSNKKILASLNAEHVRVRQKEDIEGADKDYTEYRYNTAITLVPNTLNLSFTGGESFRVVDRQQEFVSDKILAAGELTKLRNHGGTLNFSIPNPKYFGLAMQSSYSETEAEQAIDGSDGFEGDNLGASIQLYQGNNAKNYTFNFSVQFNDTSRTNFQDFKSTQAQGSIGVAIAPKFNFVLNGNTEEYDVDLEGNSRRTNLDSTSYGAGIEWRPTNVRSISLTYNQLEEGDNETNFVGANIDWALSTRTAVNIDVSKRFYGDAYSVDISHNLRSVRSSIAYSEQVTSFARLTGTTTTLGLFVCQFGSTDLTDCFQPESVNYELQAGEEFRTLSELSSDITEEILFRKSGSFNLAYDKRRVKAAITASYGKTEYLESNREQSSRSIRLNLSYELGRKTEVSLSTLFARNAFNNIVEPDDIIKVNLDFERSIGQGLQVNAGFAAVERESEEVGRNISDKRLTLGASYRF